MGVRVEGRTPTSRPGWNLFWAAVLLSCTFGIVLAAAVEAHGKGDTFWMIFFSCSVAGCLGFYAWIVHGWMAWMSLSGDYTDVDAEVCSDGEYDYPGEHGYAGPPDPFN